MLLVERVGDWAMRVEEGDVGNVAIRLTSNQGVVEGKEGSMVKPHWVDGACL